jgi:choice-of-anchor B domain-containing protein
MKKVIFLALLFSSFWVQAQDSLNLKTVFRWEDPTLPQAVYIRNVYNEVWGWYDSVKNREYAIIGSTEGVHFFDITDPANAYQAAFVKGRESEMIHRDFKNKGHYLYAVADEFAESLKVIDMSPLPDSVRVVYDEDSLFNRSHNIWIDGDRMYASSPRLTTGPIINGMAIYDISNPEVPLLIKEYRTTMHPWEKIHDLYVRNDTAYLHCENRGMYVVDFSDPINYKVLTQFSGYPFMGYNHSGWLSEDSRYYAMADETHGMPVKYLDVSDLSNIEVKSYLFPEGEFPITDTFAIAHNPLIKGNEVYISYYYDGLYVWDVSQPDSPYVKGFYDTYPGENRGFYHGAWGVYPYLPSGRILVSDMQTGLYVLEWDLPGTGLEENFETSVSVFPNPSQGRIQIQAQTALQEVQLQLYDLTGKLWAKREEKRLAEGDRISWDLSADLSPGMYLLHIQSENQSTVKQLLIQRD